MLKLKKLLSTTLTVLLVTATVGENTFAALAKSDTTNGTEVETKGTIVGSETELVDEDSDLSIQGLSEEEEISLLDEEGNITIHSDASQRIFTIEVKGIQESITDVSIPVWSEYNGQDDIIWYAAQKKEDGLWTCDVDIKNHKSDSGKYVAHVYYKNEQQLFLYDASEFKVDAITNGVMECTSADADLGVYTLGVSDVYSPAGIKDISVEVWSETAGEKALYRYKAEKTGESWKATVYTSNHSYASGNYIAKAYATDHRDMTSMIATTKFSVSATQKNQVNVFLNNAQTEATITVKNADQADGIKSVQVAVWGDKDGQNDLQWYTMSSEASGNYQIVIPIKNHKEFGNYNVHVYAVTTKTGQLAFLGHSNFEIDGMTSGTITCIEENQDDGIYTINAVGMKSLAGIKTVSFSVWSKANGQDDIVQYEAKKVGDSWQTEIFAANHAYVTGEYEIAAYATDMRGMKQLVAKGSIDVKEAKVNQIETHLNDSQTEVTITLKNVYAPKEIHGVQIAVWGSQNGQNDIAWYIANEDEDGKYSLTFPIKNHKELGTYNVHVYARNNQELYFAAADQFEVEGVSGKVSVINQDNEKGYFDVKITEMTGPCKVDTVLVPIWSSLNGQDDIRWYTAEKENDSWIVKDVDMAEHKADIGTYYIHAYAIDERGIQQFISNIETEVLKPTVVPTIQAKVLSGDQEVLVTIENLIGATQVRIPVWCEKNGQNDICWYAAKQTRGRNWELTVPLVNHMEIGMYNAHVYATINGKETCVGGTTVDVKKINVNNISVYNINQNKGTFSVKVENITGLSKVTKVEAAVWSENEGRDDLRWYNAKNVNGAWCMDVDVADHVYDQGLYNIHVYAYDNAGNCVCVGGVTTEIKINGKYGFVREGGNVYFYPEVNKKAYGFERISGQRYFFDRSTGVMAVGWKYVDGYKYYFDDKGVMQQDIDHLIGEQSAYYLMINKQSNCVTLYAYDAATNSYCIPVKSMLCSTGNPTPLGTYNLGRTYRWLLMYNGTYCQYCSLITGNFLIHSITYEKTNIYTLQTVGYNMLGINKSAGCVRLKCGDAYRVYNLVNSGRLRQVKLYNSANPGPFDKPVNYPIPETQRWDPTDPAI